jgi:hypothetical protein
MLKRMLLVVNAFFSVLIAPSLVFAEQKSNSLARNREQPPIRYIAEDGVPKDKAAEKRRDFAVLEAALNDLTSPKNPEYKYWVQNGGPGREMVVDDKTYGYSLDFDGESDNIDHEDARKVPADVLDDLKRRSRAPARSLADFKPANRDIIICDLDRLFEGAIDREELPLDAFRKKYPTAWGFVWAYPPGYSRDGKTAVVLFEGGPNGIHGLNWVYMVVNKGKRWEVQWRHLRPRE